MGLELMTERLTSRDSACAPPASLIEGDNGRETNHTTGANFVILEPWAKVQDGPPGSLPPTNPQLARALLLDHSTPMPAIFAN